MQDPDNNGDIYNGEQKEGLSGQLQEWVHRWEGCFSYTLLTSYQTNFKPGIVVQAYNPSTQEPKERGQDGLHSEILPQK